MTSSAEDTIHLNTGTSDDVDAQEDSQKDLPCGQQDVFSQQLATLWHLPVPSTQQHQQHQQQLLNCQTMGSPSWNLRENNLSMRIFN